MDSMQRLATYLRADLHEHAAVTLDAGPDGTGTVTIEPHEPAAMTLTVSGGRDEILGIEFAGVAAVECLGNRRTLQGRTMQPVDELSLLISAVATGGTELFASAVRGRLLCLGGPTAERSRRVRRMRQVGGWARSRRSSARCRPSSEPSTPPRHSSSPPTDCLCRARAGSNWPADEAPAPPTTSPWATQC